MHKCERHIEAEDESYTATRPCGKPATWWTDDVGPVTAWFCDVHMVEVAQEVDPIQFGRQEQPR